MPGGFDEDMRGGDLSDVGEMELDGEQEGSSEGETWHSQESSDSESESHLCIVKIVRRIVTMKMILVD